MTKEKTRNINNNNNNNGERKTTMTTTKSTTAAKDKTSMQLNKQTKNNISRQAFDG